jgi:hypothetical protein
MRSRWIETLALGLLLGFASPCAENGWLAPSVRGTATGEAVAAERTAARPAAVPQMQFRLHRVIDQQQGGLVVATIVVPQNWRVASRVEWNYQDVSHPVRAMARAEAPDGSAWVEYFPIEISYWLEPVRSPVPLGARSLGMIHAPHIRVQDAMQHFVLAPYRGRMPALQVVSTRSVTGLAEAFGLPPSPGEAMAVRLARSTPPGRSTRHGCCSNSPRSSTGSSPRATR